MTARATYLFSLGLFVLLAIGIVASVWINEQVGPTDLHGPVALMYIFPFLILFASGALILAVLVFRTRLAVLPTVIGYLPLGVILLAVFGMFLLWRSV